MGKACLHFSTWIRTRYSPHGYQDRGGFLADHHAGKLLHDTGGVNRGHGTPTVRGVCSIKIDIFLSPTESTVFVLIPLLRASCGQSYLPCSMAQFSGVVSVQYSPAYKKFLAALSVVNLNLGYILSLSCVVETNFYDRLILVTIAPVAVLGALAITCRVAMLRNGHLDKAIARNKRLSVGFFLLFFVVYSSVSYTIFQTFVCDPLDSGVTYLRADYALLCWTRTHIRFMTYAGIMVLVYPVGIPAVFVWALFKNRDSIKGVAETPDRTQCINRNGINSEGGTTDSSLLEAIKDLWAPYNRNRYYYEVIECGRGITLTGLAVFIYPGSTAQVAIELLLAFAFFSISEMLSPFAEPLNAWLYRSGTWVIFLGMFLALLLKMDVADEDDHSQDVFAGLLIAAHVGMVLVVIANSFLSIMKEFQDVQIKDIPSRQSRYGKEDGIGMLEEDEDDTSKYTSNPIVAERRQSNFAPL